jgi:pyroglutamyl-peptidase
MSEKLRISITGFGPFPGAPFNPTGPLVIRLLRLRRPAFGEVELSGHIFPVTYKAVDRELPELLAKLQPHALLMFGLASRTPYVRIETRARNAVTTLWPDADHTRIRKGSIRPPHRQTFPRSAFDWYRCQSLARRRQLSLQLFELARDRGNLWR